MKRTNFRTTISLLWCVAALLMVLPRPGAGDEAQAPAQFSVGDHVLVSPTGAKNDYRPGVIIEVRANQAYLVETDDSYGGIERCNVLGAWVKSAPVAAKVPDTKAPDADETGNAGGSDPNGSGPGAAPVGRGRADVPSGREDRRALGILEGMAKRGEIVEERQQTVRHAPDLRAQGLTTDGPAHVLTVYSAFRRTLSVRRAFPRSKVG